MSFRIKQFDIGPMQNFGYLIIDEKTNEALIVDPAWEPDTLLKKCKEEGATPKGLVVTHAHYDHTNAIEQLLTDIDVPVYSNKEEVKYSQSGTSIVASLGKTVKPQEGGGTVKLGETDVTFLHTPGHTPGSQCIKVGNNLLTGDTLFIGGCGRADLPGGDASTLFKSLQKIASLSSDLMIWPGHDYGTTPNRLLSDEVDENPYLKMPSEEHFLNMVG